MNTSNTNSLHECRNSWCNIYTENTCNMNISHAGEDTHQNLQNVNFQVVKQ